MCCGQKWTEPPLTSPAPLKSPAGFGYQPRIGNISENIGLSRLKSCEISDFATQFLDSCLCVLMRVLETNGKVLSGAVICSGMQTGAKRSLGRRHAGTVFVNKVLVANFVKSY